jgi:hypothetical protein
MNGQGNQRELELAPRWEIPDTWAGNGLCPICGCQGLQVVHLPGYPDYFVCKHCEISFELERGGKLVRLKYIPEDMDQVYERLRFRWVDVISVRDLALKDRPSLLHQSQKKEIISPPAALTDEEVVSRALGMFRLGNKPKMIEMILLQAGATPEQAARAFESLKRLEKQSARKQSSKFFWMVTIIMLILMALAGGLYFSGWFEARRAAAVAVEAIPVQELLLKQVQKKLPDSIIYKTGPQATGCPTTPTDAAQLFGGEAGTWERVSMYSWQMTNTDRMVTVMIPDGMTVAYFKNPSLEFVNGYGPLTITNVNFAMVTCE